MKAVTATFILLLILLITSACGNSDGIAVLEAWARPGL